MSLFELLWPCDPGVAAAALMGSSRHRYVIGTLELLVAENYMIVYLNGATSRKRMPTVSWLRKCYQQIDRRWAAVVFTTFDLTSPWILHRLRKNLKSLIIVHPSWFIRTLLALTKPFIRSEVALATNQRSWDVSPDSDPHSSFHSSKFSQKIQYVYSLADLAELVPMEYVSIPDCIKQWVFAQTWSVIGLLKRIWLIAIVVYKSVDCCWTCLRSLGWFPA